MRFYSSLVLGRCRRAGVGACSGAEVAAEVGESLFANCCSTVTGLNKQVTADNEDLETGCSAKGRYCVEPGCQREPDAWQVVGSLMSAVADKLGRTKCAIAWIS